MDPNGMYIMGMLFTKEQLTWYMYNIRQNCNTVPVQMVPGSNTT